jgi:hypothetical protein
LPGICINTKVEKKNPAKQDLLSTKDGHCHFKSNDYLAISSKNPKKITIISLLVTGQP